MMTISRSGFALLLPLILAASGCDAIESSARAPESRDSVPVTQVEPARDFSQKVDPSPLPVKTPMIVSKAEIRVAGEPACAFTIRYPGNVDQEVTWRKESCEVIKTGFLSMQDLEKTGAKAKLNAEETADIERHGADGVFFVESEFTASVFPLNVAGRAYEISIID